MEWFFRFSQPKILARTQNIRVYANEESLFKSLNKVHEGKEQNRKQVYYFEFQRLIVLLID